MKKLLISLVSLLAIVAVAFSAFMFTGTKSILTGYSLRCSNDSYMIIEETGSPIRYSFSDAVGTNVEKLTDGDRILIISGLINASYPGSTRAYIVLKLSDGDIADVPQETLVSLEELGWYKTEEY